MSAEVRDEYIKYNTSFRIIYLDRSIFVISSSKKHHRKNFGHFTNYVVPKMFVQYIYNLIFNFNVKVSFLFHEFVYDLFDLYLVT